MCIATTSPNVRCAEPRERALGRRGLLVQKTGFRTCSDSKTDAFSGVAHVYQAKPENKHRLYYAKPPKVPVLRSGAPKRVWFCWAEPETSRCDGAPPGGQKEKNRLNKVAEKPITPRSGSNWANFLLNSFRNFPPVTSRAGGIRKMRGPRCRRSTPPAPRRAAGTSTRPRSGTRSSRSGGRGTRPTPPPRAGVRARRSSTTRSTSHECVPPVDSVNRRAPLGSRASSSTSAALSHEPCVPANDDTSGKEHPLIR